MVTVDTWRYLTKPEVEELRRLRFSVNSEWKRKKTFAFWTVFDQYGNALTFLGLEKIKLSLEQLKALRFFRGTGDYVGKDARMRYKNPGARFRFRTLMELSRRGLLKHFMGYDWYLTQAGREFIRRGITPKECE